jgi:hypothetical protein
VSEAPENMTVEKLEARIRFHQSTADMYRERDEPGMEVKFRDLAALYENELKRRPKAVSA